MYFLVVDGETCNTPIVDGQLDMKNGQDYDLGGMIIDEFGNEYERFSMVNEDVFYGMPEQMKDAYYASKIPMYNDDLMQGRRIMGDTLDLYYHVRRLCKKYNVQAIVAHNARFDVATLNSTIRYQTKSEKRWFFPWGIRILDSVKIAKMVYGKDEKYIQWCKDNGYMTNHVKPQPRMTAEVLWRYISGNNDFQESHTGLEDVEIESVIFTKCLEALRNKASSLRAGSCLRLTNE